jgi:phage-related protein
MASDAVVNLVVNATDAEAQVNLQLRRIVNDAERRAPDISLQVNIDNSSVVNAINALNAQITSANRSSDDSTRGLSDTFTGLAGGIGRAVAASTRLVAIGGIASQAIPLVAGLATTIQSLVPAAAAGVSAFLTIKAAALTLKLGLTGVQDAITAVFDPDADPAKVAEALEKLSGNARDFVLELQTMKPAFDKLRLDVQDRLFAGLDDQLKSVAKSTFPELRTAARSFADTFNDMAKGVASGAREVGDNGTLGKALGEGTTAFAKFERIPGQVLVAVTQLAAAGGPLLNRFVDKIVDLADSASKALSGAFESGALEDAVNAAGDTLAQLGRIAGNVFGVLGNLMDAAGDSGTGLFGALEQVTQALEDLTATTEFQDTLGALISVGQTLVSNILPLLAAAFEAVAPAIQILAPYVEDIVDMLGTQLLELIPELAPVLEQLATLFGEILVAVTPLIEQGINLLIELMPELIPLFDALIALVQDLAPLIEYFAVGAVALLGPVLEIAIGLLTDFVWGLDLVATALQITIEWVGKFALSLTNQADPGVRAFTQLMNGDFQGALQTSTNALRDFSLRGADYILDFAGVGGSYILGFVITARDSVIRGFNDISNTILRKTTDAIAYVQNLRDRILAYVESLPGRMYAAGANMMSSLADGILSQLGPAISAANTVVGAIRDFFPSSPAKRGPFSGKGYPLYSGEEVVASFIRGMERRARRGGVAVGRVMDMLKPQSSSGPDPLGGLVADGSGFAGIANTTFARLTPNVNVYLGNEQLTPYFQTVVDEDTLQRDRLAAQGARG